MPLTVTCPGCNAPLRVRDELVGKKVKCPRCAGVVQVPRAAPVGASPAAAAPPPPAAAPPPVPHAEQVRPAPRAAAAHHPQPATAIGEGAPGARPAARRRHEEPPEDEDEPRPRKRRVDYKPCPRCGSGGATRVTWTPWGSFYGPAMLTHVRCPKCGYAYNGRTGGSNTVAAVLFVMVPLILILAIIFGLLLALLIIRF